MVSEAGNVVVQGEPNNALWFTKSGSTFQGDLCVKQTLTLDSAAQLFRLFDLDGAVTEFDSVTGMFRRRVDAAGNQIEVTGLSTNGYNFTKVERTYTSGDVTTTEQFLYDYTAPTGDTLLDRVTLRRQVDAGSWTNVVRAVYTYYSAGDSYGAAGDLKTVATQTWDGSAWVNTGTTLYRYWLSLSSSSSSSLSSSSSSSSGADDAVHLLKYVVLPASYDRLAADPNVTDPTTASNSIVAQYADHYFEYGAERQVVREMVQGGSRTFTFAFSQSAFADGYNSWKYKNLESLPSGAQNIVYSNYAGQTMLKGAPGWQ